MTSPKKLYIFGKTDLAQLLAKHMINNNQKPDAFVVDDKYCLKNEKILGISVISYTALQAQCPPPNGKIFVCVGYSNMNENRKNIIERFKAKGYEIGSYVHPSATISADINLESALVFQNVSIDAFTTIGEGNIFYPGANICHHSKIGDYNFFAPSCCVLGHVTIGNNNFIGANSSIKNGCTIEDKCMIGASAYVAHDLEKEVVIVPERSIILEKKSTELISKVVTE